MKKLKLGAAILLTAVLLVLVVLAARFVVTMIAGLGRAGTQALDTDAQEQSWAPPDGAWAAPTIDPYELSDQAYDAPDPDAPEDSPAPQERLVTVPVLETAQQLAEEEG